MVGLHVSFAFARLLQHSYLKFLHSLIRILYALIDTTISYRRSICPTIRKHGRWKCRNVLPASWLVLSVFTLTSSQVTSFTALRHHQLESLMGIPAHEVHPHSISRRKTPYREWIPFFNDAYALSEHFEQGEFYRPDLFDFVFSDSQPSTHSVSSIPSHLLAVHGTLMAELWMESMARDFDPLFSRNESSFCQGEDDDAKSVETSTTANTSISDTSNVSLSDVLSFRSVKSIDVTTPIHQLSDRLMQALLELSNDHAQLTTVASPAHHVSSEHFLRSSHSNKPDQLNAETFSVLIDSGCSVSCSGFKGDFHGELAMGNFGFVNTADGRAKIDGFGILRWDVISKKGKRRTIMVPGYYSSAVPMRLLSPQDYCNYHQLDPAVPQYRGSSSWMSLDVKTSEELGDSNTEEVLAHITSDSRLPFVFAELSHRDVNEPKDNSETRCHCHVTSVYDVRNTNLSAAQKKLKLDHDRLGHLSMQLIQKLYQPEHKSMPDFDGFPTSGLPCLLAKDAAQLRCDIPICEACEIARARKRPTGTSTKIPVPETVDSLRAEDLAPGDTVSVDQYESSVRGRRLETKGREREDRKFCGGTLFYDHASGRIFVQHQTSLSAYESIQAKNAFEREAALCGFTIKKYRTDNGIFSAKDYKESLTEGQSATRAGVGAHHQNGVAEANIGRVQRMARAMLLHLRLHWPEEFSPDLWPFALEYAVYIYNHVPRQGKAGAPSPAEVFCGTKIGCRPLRRLRVFGAPTYVLDPRLQDGKKIPKWEPRSRQGQFLGFSKEHASTIGLIRNIRTGYISPQFHVVYDELFTTVASDHSLDLDEHWIELFLNSREAYLDSHDESVDGPLPALDPDFQPPGYEDHSKQGEVRQDHHVGQGEPSQPVQVPELRSRETAPTHASQDDHFHGGDDDFQEAPQATTDSSRVLPDNDLFDGFDMQRRQTSEPQPSQSGSRVIEVEVPPQPAEQQNDDAVPPSPFRPRRSTRPRNEWSEPPLTYDSLGGQAHLLRHVSSRFFDYIVSSSNPDVIAYATVDWESVTTEPLYHHFHDLFTLQIDAETLELYDAQEAFHPFAFSAKVQSEDFPTYGEILRMDSTERFKWLEAMDKEIQDLVDRNSFELVPRSEPMSKGEQIIKSMWAFRRKRKPSGEISRYKARLCVRGDLQRASSSYTTNETFAPVVEWSTVRMLFTLGVMHDWKSASIDFRSAFTQGQLPQPIYLELPPGYQKANPHLADKVMKITTSLYGEQRAANLWYNKIREDLVKNQGFTVSEYDPCLFIRDNCLLCLYVDDALIYARDDKTVNDLLTAIDKAGFAFDRDEDFSSYLGVKVEHNEDGSVTLTQPGLTGQLLDMMGMRDCNPARTPITTPLFTHADSEPHNGSFNFRSALGMMMYLVNNTRPECAFAVNSCAQYSINPKQPHAEAVRRICRYFKGTIDKGITIKPNSATIKLDCYVDADYAGHWTSTEADNPASVKSRAGYVINLGSVPVLWKSKRIQEICLSTMEAEYISLSMAMRSLIYLRGLMFEIDGIFGLGVGDSISTISTVFEDNSAARILATTDPPRMTPRSKSLAVKYHWFRSRLSPETILVEAVASAQNMADIFTKALPFETFARHRKTICGY